MLELHVVMDSHSLGTRNDPARGGDCHFGGINLDGDAGRRVKSLGRHTWVLVWQGKSGQKCLVCSGCVGEEGGLQDSRGAESGPQTDIRNAALPAREAW